MQRHISKPAICNAGYISNECANFVFVRRVATIANMSVSKILLIVALTLISGFGDSRGFLYSARVWQNGKFILREAVHSALGFMLGILAYWIVIRFLQQVGVVSPELQTLLWFSVTIVGVAITSGQFVHWGLLNQVIGLVVLVGIGILLYRTGG